MFLGLGLCIFTRDVCRWLWEIGIIIACLIFLVLEPLRATFYPDDHLMKFSNWKKQFQYHIIFLLDVLFNLRTGLVQGKTDIVTLDGKKVFFTYLGGWFFVDLVSSLPMNGLYMLFRHAYVEEDDKLFDTFRVLSVTKLLLTFRLVRYLRRIETVSGTQRNFRQLLCCYFGMNGFKYFK